MRLHRSAALGFVALFAVALGPITVLADEPAGKEEPAKREANALQELLTRGDDLARVELILAQNDLAGTVRLALADWLVAPNGLGIDVATPEPALRAQLGLEENAGLVVTS